MRHLILSVLAIAGCGGGSNCTVVENDDGSATITCEDGTTATVDDGTDGMDGASCTVRDEGAVRVIECDDGTTVTVRDGMDGPDGSDGTDGTDGTDGQNASVTGAGLSLEVREVGIDADRRPYAVLRFTDGDGRPLDRTGTLTEGAIDARFTVAYLPTETRIDGDVVLPYVNYVTEMVTSEDGTRTVEQAAADRDGTWSEVDPADGVYRYAFEVTLPDDYPRDKTHTIGVAARRTFEGVRYVANGVESFRPDAAPITDTRDVVTTSACNSCHTQLVGHGGTYRNTRLCATCHSAGYADAETGNTLDFQAMVHRIHRSADLPSVEAGVAYELDGDDFSNVHFPRDVRECAVCHTGTDGERWNTEPSRAACGSCHDDIWFEAGDPPAPWMALHPGGDRPDDDRCAVCHEPSGPALSPIDASHFTKFQEPFAVDLEVVIHDAAMTAGRQVRVEFSVLVDGVGRDILAAPLTSLSATVAGPTTDYLFNAGFTLTSAAVGTLAAVDAPAGRFAWTSTATVDTIASTALADPLRSAPGISTNGTWAIGLQATLRINGDPTLVACTGTSTTTCTAAAPAPMGGRWGCVSGFCTEQFDYAATNPVAYFALTDAVPVPRREVVAIAQCNGCHQQLALHGGGRNAPEYCAMCHNSTFDTVDRMPVPTGTTVETHSLSFANFVHRLHTGDDGVSDATFWGPRPASPINSGGTPVDFSEVRFPADRRACETCHTEPADAIDLFALEGLEAPRTRLIDDQRRTLETHFLGVTTSACTGCHDSPSSIAHAQTMTAISGTESCATCHATGSTFGVDTVHARPSFVLP